MPLTARDAEDIFRVQRWLKCKRVRGEGIGPQVAYFMVCLIRAAKRPEPMLVLYDWWADEFERVSPDREHPGLVQGQMATAAKRLRWQIAKAGLPIKIRNVSRLGYELTAPPGYKWPI